MKLFAKWDTSYGLEPLPWIDPFCSLDASERGRVVPQELVVGPEAIHWFQHVEEVCGRNERRDIVGIMAKEIAVEVDMKILRELFG